MVNDPNGARSVVITGSAQGLGLTMAHEFAAAGHRVCLTDLPGGRLTAAAEQVRGCHPQADVAATAADVTDDDSVADLMAEVAEWCEGRLDVLVNNAGVISRSPTEEMPTAVWQRDLDVNLGGTFRCSRAAQPLLLHGEVPCVINMGSLGSSLGMPRRAGYNSAKTAIVGLTSTLAAEWGPTGIRVNAIAPGFIETTMMRSGFEQGLLDEEVMKQRIPLRRLGAPEEISRVAVFLASPAASYVNGVVLRVDGGTVIDGTFF